MLSHRVPTVEAVMPFLPFDPDDDVVQPLQLAVDAVVLAFVGDVLARFVQTVAEIPKAPVLLQFRAAGDSLPVASVTKLSPPSLGKPAWA